MLTPLVFSSLMLGGALRSQIHQADENLEVLQSALVISRQKLAESCAQFFSSRKNCWQRYTKTLSLKSLGCLQSLMLNSQNVFNYKKWYILLRLRDRKAKLNLAIARLKSQDMEVPEPKQTPKGFGQQITCHGFFKSLYGLMGMFPPITCKNQQSKLHGIYGVYLVGDSPW